MAKAEPQLYKAADACRMAEVAPYVLRYWETEFPALSEGKEKGSTRLYTARDVQIIARIRQLLYDEGFTVAGAKKRLESDIQEGRFDDGVKPAPKAAPVAPQAPASATPPVTARRLEDVPLVQAEPPRPPPLAPRPAAPPAPAPRPTPVVAAAPAVETSGFAEKKAVIKELKEIVKLLEKPKKR